MCEHNKKAKIFCATEQCDHCVSFGCMECIKKYHKAASKNVLVEEEELLDLLKVYQVPNHIKEQRRRPIYRLYQMLTNYKNQINGQLERYFGGILSKLKYPFLYHENMLDTYRIIRDKNYHKLAHSELISFYKNSQKLDSQAFIAKEVQFYQQYVKQTRDSIQQLNNKIKMIQNTLDFKISQQTIVMKVDASNEFDALAKKYQKEQQSVANWSKVNNAINPIKGERTKNRDEFFLTPKKSEENFDISMEKSPSIISFEDKQTFKLDYILQKTQKNDRSASLPKQLNQSMLLFSAKKSNLIDKKQKEKEEQQNASKLSKSNVSHSILNEYQGKNSQTDSLFIKISEASLPINNCQKLNFVDTNSTIHPSFVDKKESIKVKQENIKKRLSLLIKQRSQKQTTKNQAQPQIKNEPNLIKSMSKDSKDFSQQKSKLQSRQSHFLSIVNKRKLTQEASFSDSLGKDVLDFPREDRIKLISKSIKKQIPFSEGASVKSEHISINQQQPLNQFQLQMAAIFLSGINQPSIQNKICFLEKYIIKYDNNLTAIEYLSYLYLQHGQPKQCHNLCSSYLDRLSGYQDDKSVNTLIINNCSALNQLGRYSQAIKSLQDRLKQSENAQMHKIIADAYISIAVIDKAVYHYERSTKLNPKLDEAYYNLAVILYQQQSFFNAKMNIDKALHLSKNNHYIQLQLHIQERIQMRSDRP